MTLFVTIIFTCPWTELILLLMRTWKDCCSHLRRTWHCWTPPRALQGYLSPLRNHLLMFYRKKNIQGVMCLGHRILGSQFLSFPPQEVARFSACWRMNVWWWHCTAVDQPALTPFVCTLIPASASSNHLLSKTPIRKLIQLELLQLDLAPSPSVFASVTWVKSESHIYNFQITQI